MSPKASEAASNKERILSSKTTCRGFESYCPCQKQKGHRVVSFLFLICTYGLIPRHVERVVGCGSPVETSKRRRCLEAPTEPAGENESVFY